MPSLPWVSEFDGGLVVICVDHVWKDGSSGMEGSHDATMVKGKESGHLCRLPSIGRRSTVTIRRASQGVIRAQRVSQSQYPCGGNTAIPSTTAGATATSLSPSHRSTVAPLFSPSALLLQCLHIIMDDGRTIGPSLGLEPSTPMALRPSCVSFSGHHLPRAFAGSLVIRLHRCPFSERGRIHRRKMA